MMGRMTISVRLAALAAAVALATPWPAAADTYPRQPGVDIQHYVFRLTLTDASDEIQGDATVDVRFVQSGVAAFELDLVNAAGRTDGRGMTVTGVTSDGAPVAFTHAGDRLRLMLAAPPETGAQRRFRIAYHGTPATGLLIGPNRHGDRTFFSDDWPDKARNWLPTIDHVSDKATCEFLVTAPAHYQVVSNGRLVEETDLPGDRRLTHWRESVPLAPWLYMLGVARFAVQQVDEYEGRPIQTWVYPQDRDTGFRDFASPTRQVLEFFGSRIGPFAYEKLANVQSRAVSGGMEAATAISYGENLVTGDRGARLRNVVIHELAHQWWGDAVTERDWDDVWLSEGFATYFTLLFIEHADGRDAFLAGLADSQDRVRAFDEKNPDYRIVHDDLADMRQVTTGQIYQKGSWTLHMLRGMVGDEVFWAGIRAYYRRYRGANASTDDFRRAMEEASGQPLDWFFRQWLHRGGYPKVQGSWRYDAAAQTVEIELAQTQAADPFDLPIEIGLDTGGRAAAIERVRLNERRQRFTIHAAAEPRAVTLDPHRWVLMDATFVRR